MDAKPRSSAKPLAEIVISGRSSLFPISWSWGLGYCSCGSCSAGRVHAGLDRIGIGIFVQSCDHGKPNALAGSASREHVSSGDRTPPRRGWFYRLGWTVDSPASANPGEEDASVCPEFKLTVWNSIGRSFHSAGDLRVKTPGITRAQDQYLKPIRLHPSQHPAVFSDGAEQAGSPIVSGVQHALPGSAWTENSWASSIVR
jgi:hypothetical protein